VFVGDSKTGRVGKGYASGKKANRQPLKKINKKKKNQGRTSKRKKGGGERAILNRHKKKIPPKKERIINFSI